MADSRGRGSALSAGFVLTSALFVAPATAQSCSPDANWSGLILSHVERYPALELADVYKLLHQATMGSEHMIEDRSNAQSWLNREIEDVMNSDGRRTAASPAAARGGSAPGESGSAEVRSSGEPVSEEIGPRFTRVHLGPFLARSGDVDRLLDAFVETANSARPDQGELECALAVAAALAATGKLHWRAEDVSTYAQTRAHEGYPAVHHSDRYVEAYRPAYRVIARALSKDVLPNN